MKRITIILTTALCLIFLFASTQHAKEPVKKTAQKEEVPLITEVMTKEELQAYLKEKGIPIITKENFKEPELVWEKTFDEPIREISDITGKGNCIIISGRMDTSKADKKLLFIDSKGNLRKEVPLGKTEMNAFAVAKSGMAAAAGKWNDKKKTLTLSYYDEEGNKLWSKDIELKDFGKIILSDNGTTIAIEEGNPNWSIEEWGGNLNISRIFFLNDKGNLIFKYKEFRNIGWGEFSGDGNFYAGLFWWQEDPKTWGKLVYINVKEGKIFWERPFGGDYWKHGELFGEHGYLAVSESGLYVSAVNVEAAERTPKGKDIFDYVEIDVFNKEGRMILKIPGSYIHAIRDEALIRVGSVRGTVSEIIKGWIDIKKQKNTGLIGEPPYFSHIEREMMWETKEGSSRRFGRPIAQKYLSMNGVELWEAPKELITADFRFTKDQHYIIAHRGNALYVYRFRIDLSKRGE